MSNGSSTLTVTPEVVSAGDPITITINNPTMGGQTATVEVDNGDGDTETVEIQLDEHGKGSKQWTVPDSGWTVVNVNMVGESEITVIVEGG